MQYKSGYIIDGLIDVFENNSQKKQNFKALVEWSSYFEFESRSGFEKENIDYSSTIAVLINILQRGAPTKLNHYAINFLVERSNLLSVDDTQESSIVIKYNNFSEESRNLVYRSLHIIEPRIDINKQKHIYEQSRVRFGSSFEEKFLFNDLPSSLGDDGAALIQLLSNQRSILSIIRGLKYASGIENQIENKFIQQSVDFSVEFPYVAQDELKGIVIEIDGPQHFVGEQMFLDIQRDNVISSYGWHNTLRVKTIEVGTSDSKKKIQNGLLPAINNEYIRHCIYNYKNPIWETDYGKEIFQICLIPFAVARIQRAILEAIAYKKLDLESSNWKIAVIERDVPCGKLAIDDLIKLINKLSVLQSNSLVLPEIDLHVFSTKEFLDSNFQDVSAQNIDAISVSIHYNLVIDISMLARTREAINYNVDASEIISIGSIHYRTRKTQVITSDLIRYNPFCINIDNSGMWTVSNREIKESLEYLLQSIFRKKGFLEGQLPIMHNALKCNSVIGLLPTGGGKSLTYQLAAFLQPGICLVIDPIRSLMKDQVDGLIRNNIDSCIFINSTLEGEAKWSAMREMANGEAQFVFISPERLQMDEFRIVLKDMFDNRRYFSYCVIDEAHCVSEWGHDFRTSYLRLGENAIKYCKTKNLKRLPIFGLTATASYDVLADVQRELSGNIENRIITEESIVRAEYSKRDELQYVVEEVTIEVDGLSNIWDLKTALGSSKQEKVKLLIREMPEIIKKYLDDPKTIFFEDDLNLNEIEKVKTFKKIQIEKYSPGDFFNGYKNAGLIFCPHTKGIFGVTDKYKELKNPFNRKGYFDRLSTIEELKTGFFMGSNSDFDDTTKAIQKDSFENQDKFINNELNLMIATKAFGMGIDKDNIRYTIHINYPNSIESYVQEAGRAGRDRKMALSYILFNDQQVSLPSEEESIDNDLDVNLYFHKNSFKGIEKEISVLWELLTDIYFPNRIFEVVNLINSKFKVEVKCQYWKGHIAHNLYFDNGFNEPLGYFNINSLTGYTNYTKRDGSTVKSILPDISDKIWEFLKNYFTNIKVNEPIHEWLLSSKKDDGIEKILDSKNVGDDFKITIGFNNDISERIKRMAKWLSVVVHPLFDVEVVQKMRGNCPDAEAFIESVCEKYQSFTGGKSLNFEARCRARDLVKGNLEGYAYRMFIALYNGYRDKMDTEKAIYRLSIIGVIDDYTVNYSSNTFTVFGKKKTDLEYKQNLYNYLLKYYSVKSAKGKLSSFEKIDEPTEIRKSLYFLVNFVYSEIEKKRLLAIHDMKLACRYGIEKGSIELKEYIDLYFNSKYARKGYSFFNSEGREINASLLDITDGGKNEDINWVWFFMSVVDEDTKAGQINNLKHLRGACTRMLRNQPDNYTLLLLSVFTFYMLEYKNPRYLQEAEDQLINAFSNIQLKEPDWSDIRLKEIFTSFTDALVDKNGELTEYMLKHSFKFDFESILISRYIKPLQKANELMKELNIKLD